MVGVEQLIIDNSKKLTQTDIYILNKINNELEEIENFSIVDLALRTNSSTSSINRLVRKLDFDNYFDFKYYLKVQKSLLNKKLEISKNVLLQNVENNFDNQISDEMIFSLVEQIKKSEIIYIVGVGQSREATIYFARMLERLHKIAIPINDSHATNTLTYQLKEKDLVIFISASGNTKTLIDCALLISNKPIYKLLITTNYLADLAKSVDETIFLQTINSTIDNYQIYGQSVIYNLIDIIIFKIIEHKKIFNNK